MFNIFSDMLESFASEFPEKFPAEQVQVYYNSKFSNHVFRPVTDELKPDENELTREDYEKFIDSVCPATGEALRVLPVPRQVTNKDLLIWKTMRVTHRPISKDNLVIHFGNPYYLFELTLGRSPERALRATP